MKKILIVLSILSAFVIAGIAGVFAAWEWESKTKSENNVIAVQAYTDVLAEYRYPGHDDDFEIAVDFTINGFGTINENLKLYICDASYSSTASLNGDWNPYLSNIWQYKSDSEGWKQFTDRNFVLEDSPKYGATYSICLRKDPELTDAEYKDGIFKFTAQLCEGGSKQIEATASPAYTDNEELKIIYTISDVGEVTGSWDLVLSELKYNSVTGEDWGAYVSEIWQYRTEGSEDWQPFVGGQVLFENVKDGENTIYVRKNPDVGVEYEGYADGIFKFTTRLQEKTK